MLLNIYPYVAAVEVGPVPNGYLMANGIKSTNIEMGKILVIYHSMWK